MSDPKSETYVSLTEDRSSSGSDGVTKKKKEEQQIDEPAVDSGFISSSSDFLSGPVPSDDEEEEDDRSSVPVSSAADLKDDLLSTRRNSANSDDKHQSPKEVGSTYLDSGVIEDLEEPEVDEMRIDKSNKEWMCISPKVQHNDLDHCSNTKNKIARQSPMEAVKHMPLWQVCYTQDEEGDTHLHLCILGKYTQAIWTIIRIAPDHHLLDVQNDDGQCAMHWAVLTSQPTVIRQLLAAGANPSIRDREGNSPLHLACINSDLLCVKALTTPITAEELQSFQSSGRSPPKCAELNVWNYNGEYCVHIAAQRSDIDILRQLVNCGANINVREGKWGYTALHYACVNANLELVNYILSECAQLEVETCSYGQLTAYQLAAEYHNEKLMEALKVYGAELLTPPESEEDYTSDEDDNSSDEAATSLNHTANKNLLATPTLPALQHTNTSCS